MKQVSFQSQRMMVKNRHTLAHFTSVLQLVLLVLAFISSSSSQEPTTIWEKELPDKRKLVVSELELSVQEKQEWIERMLREFDSDAGNVRLVIPDRLTTNTFYLSSAEKVPPVYLWKWTVAHYTKTGIPSNYRIFDVLYDSEDQRLLILSKKTGYTDVMTVSVAKTAGKPVEIAVPESLTRDSEAEGLVVVSANFTKQDKESQLSIALKYNTGADALFQWKDGKWLKRDSPVHKVIEDDITQPDPIKDEKVPRITIIYYKRPPNVKAFGEGLHIKREKLLTAPLPAEFENLPPDANLALPKQSYRYWAEDYHFRDSKTPGEKFGVTSFLDLWSLRVDDFSADGKASELKVFDALHEPQSEKGDQPGVFTIIYQQGKTLYASVTKPDERGQRIAMPEKDTVLLKPVEAGQIVSAKLSGSAKDGTLAIEVRFADGTTQNFLWKDAKWAKQ